MILHSLQWHAYKIFIDHKFGDKLLIPRHALAKRFEHHLQRYNIVKEVNNATAYIHYGIIYIFSPNRQCSPCEKH